MEEQHLRTAFVDLADAPAPPTTVDIPSAVRRAHRASVTRRSVLAGGAALGLTTVAGGVYAAERWWAGAPVPVPLAGPSSAPPPATTAPPEPADPLTRTTLPVAPARFDAFVEWAAFGWLPDESPAISLTIQPELVQLIAPIPGQTKERRRSVLLNLNSAGRELSRCGPVRPWNGCRTSAAGPQCALSCRPRLCCAGGTPLTDGPSWRWTACRATTCEPC